MASTLSASAAVGEILKSPDDLLKIAALRKKLHKEKTAIDIQLKGGVKDQLDATREGLRKLLATKDNLQTIQDEMMSVEKTCRDPNNTVKAFTKISRVSSIHRNFAQTDTIFLTLQETSSKVLHLAELLDSDREDSLGPQPYLLHIHSHLIRLESFRNETIHQAKKSADTETTNVVKQYFERLDQLIEAFDKHIWELVDGFLELARADRRGVLVKIAKIVEVEGKHDEKAAAMKLVMRSKTDAAAKFKSMQAEARTIKHYRHKLIKTFTSTVESYFKSAYQPGITDPNEFVDNLGWVYKDLIRIESDVVPCFPSDYNLHEFFVKLYHNQLDEVLSSIVKEAPEASVLLRIHAWVKEYKASMKELEIPPAWLTPPILNGHEQELIEDYVGVIVRKMDEWTENLMKNERHDFVFRDQPPEMEDNGMYGLQGAVIMFQMVNQQVDLAADSGQGGVLARVVSEANRAMRVTQSQFISLVEVEVKKMLEKPDESPPGLVEYVIALANDQIKSADYAEALSSRLEPIVSDKYKVVIVDKINDAIDGYLDVAKKCTQTLIDLVFNDVKAATKQLFTPAWYTEQPMLQIVETMRDYMGDYKDHLNPSIFDLLLEDLIDTFLTTYLTALRRCSKLKMPAAVNKIRQDIGEVFTFFATFKQREDLELNFEVVEMILAILESSKEMAFLDYWSFAQAHGPNIAFVDALFRMRDNLDRSAVNEIMENIKRRVKDEGLGDPPEGTIMTKISNLTSKGDGLFAGFSAMNVPSLLPTLGRG